jgi:hypothetical protein
MVMEKIFFVFFSTCKHSTGPMDGFCHNCVARFVDMLYTPFDMINVSQVQGLFSIAHSHIFFVESHDLSWGKTLPSMDCI